MERFFQKNIILGLKYFCLPRKKLSADRYCAGNTLILLGHVGDRETFLRICHICVFKTYTKEREIRREDIELLPDV